MRKAFVAAVLFLAIVSCFGAYGHGWMMIVPAYGQFVCSSAATGDEYVFTSWQTPLNALNFYIYGTAGRSIRMDFGDGHSENLAFVAGPNLVVYHYSSTGSYIVRFTGAISNVREYACDDASLVLTMEQLSKLYNLVGFSSSTARSITGDISHIPRKVTDFNCWGAISGDLADLPPTMTAFLAKGSCQISDYTFGHTWASGMRSFRLDVKSPYGLTTAEVDDLLIVHVSII